MAALGTRKKYDGSSRQESEIPRAVITIAVGKPIYLAMAINLARSFLFWNKASDIEFFIISDLAVSLPADLYRVKLMSVAPGELGHGYSAKLHLDRFAPAKQTLFIDADCLCMGDLTSLFNRFSGHHVSVIGSTIAEGEWFGDVANVCFHFNLVSLPYFVGGVYYLEPGVTADNVYARARALQLDYDQLGLVRLRGQANDELLMAIAMALEGCSAIADDGSFMGDPLHHPNILEMNVLRGKCRLFNPPPPDPLHQSRYPSGEIRPLIAHFLGHFNSCWQYKAEAVKLRLVLENGMPVAAAGLLINLSYKIWANWQFEIKAKLRPAFHRLLGPRKLKRINR